MLKYMSHCAYRASPEGLALCWRANLRVTHYHGAVPVVRVHTLDRPRGRSTRVETPAFRVIVDPAKLPVFMELLTSSPMSSMPADTYGTWDGSVY